MVERAAAKVARWIEQRTGAGKVHAQRGWEYLRRRCDTAPRPSNARGVDASEREAFKKSLRVKLEKLQEAYPKAEQVELWAEDEARLGLKPVIRRVWAPVGRRPIARVERGYEWTYLYGFVRPESGEVFWLILPTVNVQLFSMALNE